MTVHSEQHVNICTVRAVHPKVVGIFQCGPQWWADAATAAATGVTSYFNEGSLVLCVPLSYSSELACIIAGPWTGTPE